MLEMWGDGIYEAKRKPKMPYKAIGELPDSTKHLPKHAKEIYMAAFNSAFPDADSEGQAHAIAWAAVEKKYHKNANGQWVAKEATMATAVKEAMSDNDRRALLQGAVTSSLAVGNTMDGPYIRDIYPDELVYVIKNKHYRMSYVIDRKGKVAFGQAELVTPITVYTTVEAKIEQLTAAVAEREETPEARRSLDNLLDLLERVDLSEETAGPLLKEADDIIAKLKEAVPVKTEEGQQYPMSAFAYTPDSVNPSSWELRLWEDTSKQVTKGQLAKAAAALSPGGLRGQKVVVAKESLPAVKQRIRAEYRKLGVDDGAIPKWVREDDETRARIHESCEVDIQEVTKEGIANGIVPIRIIAPGFNTSKGRFYSEQAIKDAAVIFEGAKMYADHPTEAEEKDRPERSIRDWVATLHETKVSEAGNAVGIAHINAGWLKEKIQNLYEQGDLQHLGTSINAVGKGTNQTIEGHKTVLVEGLVKSTFQSVDFVTEAGAGGQAGLRESATDSIVDADLIDLATLREARPDLVEAIETTIREQINLEVKAKMELEQENKDLKEQVETLTKENDGLKEAAVAAEKAKVKEAAQAAIKEAVDKSDLPAAAKDKIIEAHKDAETEEGIEDAIKAEVAYIATITESGKIRGLGPGPSEEDQTKTKEALDKALDKMAGK